MKYKKLAIASVLALGAIFLYRLVFSGVTVQDVQQWILRWGALAPLAYILAFSLLPAFLFPAAILVLAGGLVFGLIPGTLYTMIGSFFNCAIMFGISRYTGRSAVERYVKKHLSPVWQARLNQANGKRGFLLLLILRFLPTVPYNLLNYAYGLTGMNFTPYMIASMIGILPGTVVYINMGDKAMDTSSPAFWLAVGLLVLLCVVTTMLSRKLFPENKKEL